MARKTNNQHHTKNGNKKSGGGSSTDGSTENGMSAAEHRQWRDAVVPPLLMRSYHLPGYNWMQDLRQYLTNNHPILGICCHHPLHPISWKVRLASLIGSTLFGLAVTNMIYLAFVFTNRDFDRSYIELDVGTNFTESRAPPELEDQVTALSVTNGNIALWTIGAAIHGLYDNIIWALAACTCFMKPGAGVSEKMDRYKSTGTFLVLLSVVVVTALCTFAVTLRAAIENGQDERDAIDQVVTSSGVSYAVFQVDGAHDYEFLIAYFVELALNYVVYYPLIGTLLFSGMLVCGKYPTLGGRPYELKELKERQQQQQQQQGANAV